MPAPQPPRLSFPASTIRQTATCNGGYPDRRRLRHASFSPQLQQVHGADGRSFVGLWSRSYAGLAGRPVQFNAECLAPRKATTLMDDQREICRTNASSGASAGAASLRSARRPASAPPVQDTHDSDSDGGSHNVHGDCGSSACHPSPIRAAGTSTVRNPILFQSCFNGIYLCLLRALKARLCRIVVACYGRQ